MEFYRVRDYSDALFKRAYHKKAYLTLQKRIKNIAVYKSGGGLGDLVHSVPLFRSFKKMFPQAKIIYLGLYQRPTCDLIFRTIPYIDEYIHYESPKKKRDFKTYFSFLRRFFRKFDLIVDTQRKFLPSFYIWLLMPKHFLSINPLFSCWRFYYKRKVHITARLLSLTRILGFGEVNFGPEFNIPPESLSIAKKFLNDFEGPFISIIPGAGNPYKSWGEEKFALLSDNLSKMGYKTILIGNESEKKLLHKIKGKMTFEPIIPLLKDARFGEDPVYSLGILKFSSLTIGNDCGGLHLATLAECPVIGIYGPTNPLKSGPLGKNNVVLYKNLPCSPCKLKSCPIDRKCLKSITVNEVVETVRFILEKP
ncbi:hypothetical protein B9J78_02545 [bacterium Unc6]|nr:hypothetical protein [bacterium Unc6]